MRNRRATSTAVAGLAIGHAVEWFILAVEEAGMLALAQLCCVVMMILGLVLLVGNIRAAMDSRTFAPLVTGGGAVGALTAGVFGAALLTVAQAMQKRAESPQEKQSE